MSKNSDMVGQLKNRAMALFLIMLLVMLPVSFAAQISGLAITGSINAGAVVKPSDTVTVRANVSQFTGENLDVSTLASRLRVGSGISFSSCVATQTAGLFSCVATFTVGSQYNSVSTQVDVLLFTDSNKIQEISRKSQVIIIDGQDPSISITGITQLGLQMEISLSATDTALPGVASSCSGFKSVELYWLNDSKTTAIPFTMQPTTGCSYTNTTRIDISSLTSGLRQLCAKVTDKAGNTNLNCKVVTLDTSRPAIYAIELSTENGPTKFIKETGTSVFVSFNTSANIDPSGFTVKVNGEEKSGVTCNNIGVCKTNSFVLNTAKMYVVDIIAKTSLGVGANVSKQIPISIDNSAPAFTTLSSNVTSSNKVYFKQGLSLIAKFVEASSGLSKNNVQLSIEGTSIGSASSCINSGSGIWTCVWNNVQYTSSKQGALTVTGSVSDILGNSGTIANATIIYDDKPPVVNSITVTSVGTSGVTSVASSGSILKVVANATDDSPLSVVGDFSNFESLTRVVSGTCTSGVCTVTSRPVGIGPYNLPAIINVTDILGNTASLPTDNIEVLFTSTETNTSYFRHSLSLTPSALELTTFPYINQRGYARVDVIGVGKAQVLKVDFKQCRSIPIVVEGNSAPTTTSVFSTTSTGTGDTRLFKSAPTVTPVNASQVLLAFTFKATPLNQSNIQFLCDVDVAGRVGDVFIPKESETILVNFSTYKLSVGEIGENYDKKLQDQIDKAKSHIGGKLATFEKLFDYAKKLCNLWKIYVMVSSAISLGGSSAKIAAIPLYATWIGAPAGQALDISGTAICSAGTATKEVVDKGMKKTFATLCSFINCETGNIASKYSPTGLLSNQIDSSSLSSVNKARIDLVLSSTNSEDTLAGAMANLCLPSIIRSLRRAQQIECQYAICLRDEVPKGIPIEACDQSYEFSSCQYKTASFFFIFDIWNSVINKIKSIVSDPFALSGTVVSFAACSISCKGTGTGFIAHACVLTRAVGEIGQITGFITGIKNDWTQNNYESQDYCAELENEE